MANIAEYLNNNRETHAIAYYFHEETTDRPMEPSRVLSLVSRCLLWQCVTYSPLSVKSTAEMCHRIGYNPNPFDIWNQLLLQDENFSKVSSPIYILVDGIEGQVLKDAINMFEQLASLKTHAFRIFISTRNQDVDEGMTSGAFAHVRLREKDRLNNRDDIVTYVRHKLNDMRAFEGTNHPRAAEYYKKIIDTIEQTAEGNFAWMAILLERLRLRHHLADIDMELSSVQEPKEKQIEAEIDRLDKELTAGEIQELNEVILWVFTSRITPSLDDLQAVISLGTHTESLMPLHRRINPLLYANESGNIYFRLEEIKRKILNQRNLNEKETSSGTPRRLQLMRAEAEIVHRYLKFVTPRNQEYDENVLERLLWGEPTKITIGYNERTAHAEVGLTCLKALTVDEDEHASNLRTYAGQYLLDHLEKSKIDHLHRDLKEQIGSLLVKLFTEAQCIDRLFWTKAGHMSHSYWQQNEGQRLQEIRKHWLHSSRGMEEVRRWLTDPIIADSTNLKNSMIARAVSKDDRRCRKHLLRPAAEQLARHLFSENVFTTRQQLTAIHFLQGYMSIIKDTPDHPHGENDGGKLQWEAVSEIERWAAQSHKIEVKNDKRPWLWNTQLVRTIFSVCSRNDREAVTKAENLLSELLKMKEKPWENSVLACQTIAEHLIKQKSYNEARQVLEKVLEQFPKDKVLDPAQGHDSMLVAVTFLDLGDIYWELNEHSLAAEMHRSSLKYDATRYSRYLHILRCYGKSRDQQAEMKESDKLTVKFLEQLTAVGEFKKHYLSRLVYDFIARDEFRRDILAAQEQPRWEKVVKKLFSRAIDVAKGCPAESFQIRKMYGYILYEARHGDNEDEMKTIWEQALDDGRPLAENGGDVQWLEIFTVVDPLASIYLKRAEKTLSEAQKMVPTDGTFHEKVRRKYDTVKRYFDLIGALGRDSDVWLSATVSCCKARYYKISKDNEKAERAVKKVIEASIAVLSDNDESNDWFAYFHLGKVFSVLADKHNAMEAWKRLERSKRSDSQLIPGFLCPGCKRMLASAVPIHMCKECFGDDYSDPRLPEEDIPLKQWKVKLKKAYRLKDEDIGNVSTVRLPSPSRRRRRLPPSVPKRDHMVD